MNVKRIAAKRDLVEPEIITALRAVGATVQPLSAKGCPDLLVGYKGVNYLLEVKTGKAKLTEDEQTWHILWQGQVTIVRSVEDALAIIGR